MNIKYVKIVILFLGTLSHAYSIGQDSTIRRIVYEYSTKCASEYETPKQKKASVNDFFVTKFKNNALKNVYVWLFRSKELIAKNTRRGFIITIYQYNSAKDAANKFQVLATVKHTQDETIFGKGWTHIILQYDYIFSVASDCDYSEERWGKLISVFDKTVQQILGKNLDSINCRCGGGCS